MDVDCYGAKVLGLSLAGEDILFYDENDISHSGIPLCFPGFGPLKNGVFTHAGENYEMGQHGFFRDSIFSLIAQGRDFLTFQLNSSVQTHRFYPFDFLFQVTYTLSEKGLHMDFWMKNESKESLPLAPGVHPYFKVENPNQIQFSSDAIIGNNNLQGYEETEAKQLIDLEGFQNDQRYRIKGCPDLHLIDHKLKETHLYRGAQSSLKIVSDSQVFNRMVIWRKTSDSKSICIEPAYEQNGLNQNPIEIAPGKSFTTRVSILLA